MLKSAVKILVIFSILWKAIFGYFDCPVSCECWSNVVQCASKGLSRFPSKLPNGTEQLRLQNNSITTLSPLLKYKKMELHTLVLQNNSIVHLLLGAFNKVSELRHLDLSSNNLRTISKSCFANLNHLKLLDLAQNMITTLAPKAFSDLILLEELNLSKNQISILSRGIFSTLTHLTTLRLNQNSIQKITDKLFIKLSSLRILNLSSNRIQLLTSAAFKGLHQLQYLNLEDNRIEKLDSHYSITQLHCREVTKIQINRHTNEEQRSISTNLGVFSALSQIQTINLSNNSLSTISYLSFSSLKQLSELWLSGNFWRCDCFLMWSVARLLNTRKNRSLLRNSMYCNKPLNLAGMQAEELISQEFTFKYTAQNISIKLLEDTAVGNNISVYQRASEQSVTSSTTIASELVLNSTLEATRSINNYKAPIKNSRPAEFPKFSTTNWSIARTVANSSFYHGQNSNRTLIIPNKFLNFSINSKISTHKNETPKIPINSDTLMIALLITAIVATTLATVAGCAYFMTKCSSENKHQKRHFSNLTTPSKQPLQESLRCSIKSYPVVYDNPLAKRPLPSQPSRQIKRSPRNKKHQECDKCINVRWTNGGVFGLGDIETEKRFSISKASQKYDKPRQIVSAASSDFPHNLQHSLRKIDATNQYFTPHAETAGILLPSEDISSQKRAIQSGSFAKMNYWSPSQSDVCNNSQGKESEYLVPLPAKKKDLYFAKASGSKHFNPNGENFDLIPLKFSKQSLSPSYSRKHHSEECLKSAKRERLMEKIMEVLEEFEALENRYYFDNSNDDMTSWKDCPQKHILKVPQRSVSHFHDKHVQEQPFNPTQDKAFLLHKATAGNLSSTSKTNAVSANDENHPNQSSNYEHDIPLSTIPSAQRKQREKSFCSSNQYYHYHPCTPVSNNRSNSHYSRLQLYSGSNSKLSNKGPAFPKYVMKEEDYRQKKTPLNCNQTTSSAIISVHKNDNLILYSDNKNKSSFLKTKSYHNSKRNQKTIRSWCVSQQPELTVLEHKKQQTEYRNSMPLYSGLLEKAMTDGLNEQDLKNTSKLKARQNHLSCKLSDFSKSQQSCFLDLSCSESEAEGYNQQLHLSSQFQAKMRKASASSLGTTSVSSIEYTSTKSNHQSLDMSKFSLNLVRNSQNHNTDQIGERKENENGVLNSSANKKPIKYSSFKETAISNQKESYFDVIEQVSTKFTNQERSNFET